MSVTLSNHTTSLKKFCEFYGIVFRKDVYLSKECYTDAKISGYLAHLRCSGGVVKVCCFCIAIVYLFLIVCFCSRM